MNRDTVETIAEPFPHKRKWNDSVENDPVKFFSKPSSRNHVTRNLMNTSIGLSHKVSPPMIDTESYISVVTQKRN